MQYSHCQQISAGKDRAKIRTIKKERGKRVGKRVAYHLVLCQHFLSGQHDSLNKNYDNAVKVNDKQRQEIRKLNQYTNDLKKQRNNEELNVDELEQYDRRQNLIFEGVPQFQNENVTEIILS